MLQPHNSDGVKLIKPAHIHVKKSKWYSEHVDSLVDTFLRILGKSGKHMVVVHQISGCLEMPLACLDLHEHAKEDIDAIVCFGVLMKGETYHFEMILDTLTESFASIAVDHKLLVLNCIIPATNVDEVAVRSADNELNKGIEAALATIEAIEWRRSLRA
jgi:6,7-dimethyl-8-ribityllumazine synthase